MSRLGRSLIKGLQEAARDGKSTWELYKDKPFKERLSMVLYTNDLLDPFFKVWYSIRGFIQNVKRLIEYAPLVWNHRNFDHAFILRFQIKLYENLYKACYVNGHHIVKEQEAHKLKTVIGLLKRVEKEEYNSAYDYLEQKYGKSEFRFERVEGSEGQPGGPYSRMIFVREERLNDKQKVQYRKDMLAAGKHEEYQRKQDLELLGKLIAKHSAKWWD